MNYKRIILISLMVLVLSLTAVSAVDIDNTVLDESSDVDDSFVESLEIQDSEKLSALPGNFHELQMEVINAPSGSVLNLTQDYNGENGLVVTVNKDLTIDGQGHTINCLDKKGCFAFTSDSGTIILKNLNIINGKNDGNIPLDDNYKGGAIKISGSARYIIDNCTFKDNFADDYGGAIYHESNKPLTIKNCQFISNKADDQDGGAIYSTGELIIENSIFSDNKVKNTDRARGGAIYCKGKTTITGSLFVNNYGDDYGGAIYNGANNPLTIKNCQFIDNEAADFDGGAIYSLGNVIVEDSVFMDNSAEDRGGAIFTEQCVNVTNSLFQSNKVDDSHGGAIYSPGKVNVVGSTFKSNKAHWYGGAIRSSEEVTVVNSTFEDNNGDQGGAIYTLRNVNVNVNQDPSGPFSSFFINNDADDLDGGAIYSDNARVVNAVFSGNSANEDGGAILACSDAHVTHCLFESNKADGAAIMQCYGGAIYAKDDISVDNCTFKDNYANDYGGAIYGDTIKINYNSGTQPFSSFFINNKVKDNDGGAVYAYYDLYALNCVFSGNTAYEDGGAIFCCDNAYLTHCLFENNKGDGADYAQNEGGAIHCKDDLTVDNCTFRNNFAYDYGGAIYADTLELKQTPSYFEYNTAKDNQGGAIWVNKFRKDVKYATFIGNRVNANDDGGAIYIDNKNKITFSDCVFIKNHCGDEGGAIYLDSSSSYLTLKNNIFIDNSAGDQGDSVFNCGHYDTVSGNFWGGKNPSKSNSQLIEWHPAPLSNEHHTDKNPLSIKFELDEDCSLVNEIVTGLVSLYNSDGSYFIDPYIYDNLFSYKLASGLKFISQGSNVVSSFVQCAGENEGKYLISASLCDYYNLSKTLNVLGIDIIDPEITTYSGGSQTFKVHLEGNKNVISKKPINVLFNLKNYLEYSDENGDAIILINNVPASPGKYDISTEVYGVNSTSTVNVLSTIIAEDVVRQYGLDSPFTVSFTDKTGQYLTMGKLIGYQIDNLRTKYSPILNDEGLFDIDVSSLDVGEHNITVFNLLTKENATFSVGILPKFGAELNDGDGQQSLDNKSNGMSGAGNSFNPLYLSGGHAESDFNNDDMANGTASNNDLANKSSTAPVKSIDNQSNSNFNFLWLLLILLVIGGYLIWKKYKK